MKYDVVIIGGGASGIVSAIEARKQYENVAIIEKESRIGKKILATGNGKCNMTNIGAKIKDYHGSFSYGIKNLFSEYSPKYIVNYFNSMGLYTFADNCGRVYPKCKQASAVLDILRNRLYQEDIEIYTDCRVTDISVGETFEIKTNLYKFSCDKLIIATGGKSSPNLGSDGSMYSLVENLGHTITKLKPALCPINVKSDILKTIKGVRADGKVSVMKKGKVVKSDSGEIQFTGESISGICAFNLSYLDYDTVRVSLMPDYSKNEIIDILKVGKMGSFNRKCNDISKKEIENLAGIINEFDFVTTGKNDYSKSQVTCGGVSGKEINTNTLESLYIPNLYFCGEIIDIDGICGGYNLQFAFASGMKAGALEW